MAKFIVNFGHPYYKSYIVEDENSLKALDRAEAHLGGSLDRVQVSCFGVYPDVIRLGYETDSDN